MKARTGRESRPALWAEVLLIVLLSAGMGAVWNWSFITGAWRGAALPKAPVAAPQLEQQGEQPPMPVGLMQIKEMYDAKEAVIVDARSAASFAEGHIAGALSLPLEEARKNPAHPLRKKLPDGATIIVYCNGFSCHDSMDLGKLLIKAGYANVYVFEGGLPEWRDAGYPVAKGGK